jgi:thiol-disulfide isomerase/thioredoxin
MIDRSRRHSSRVPTILALVMAVFVLGANAVAGEEFPDRYYFYNGKRPQVQRLRALEGKPAPELRLKGWIGEPQTLDTLKGKIAVIDFWATWCGPCMRALPKNRQLADKYRDQGVVFIGIHDANRGHERMAGVVSQMKLNYPVAIDDARRSEQAWRVGFWPTYAVIDRDGIVRAAGITPNNIEPVIKKILAQPTYEAVDDAAPVEGSSAIPSGWLEGDAAKRARLDRLVAADAPPALGNATNWMNSEPLDLAELKGKVVLLDFWATWCGPCLRAIPKTNAMQQRFGDDLVIIGVCHPKGGEKMADVVEERKINYPVCLDVGRGLISAYGVNGFPDYYLIDRSGKLRVADLKNALVERAVEFLVNEKAE